MAEHLTAQVNGRLYAAGLVLQRANAAADGGDSVLAQALYEGVVLQLIAAYRFYLREIAEAYRYRGACDSAAALRTGLRADGRDSAEVRALCEAEQHGALASLRVAWQAAAGEISTSPDSGAQLLARTGFTRLDHEQCQGWLEALRGLVQSQREQLQEW